MANWRFTDDYGTQYPGLFDSTLFVLAFSDHSISDGTFTGTIDIAACGGSLELIGAILGVTSITVSGAITTTGTFSVALVSTDILNASNIPIIGSYIQSVGLAITTSALPQADETQDDSFTLSLDIKYVGTDNTVTGTLATQVPMAYGSFSVRGTFDGITVSLADLDFLLPQGTSFSTFFPSKNVFLQSVYSATDDLQLLQIDLGLYASSSSGQLSLSVLKLAVTVGIVNIPIYNNALFLNPLAVTVAFYDLTATPWSLWSINGTFALYPVASQTNPPSVLPDFTFEVVMTLPIDGVPFSIAAEFVNTGNQPISTLMQDLFGAETTLGTDADALVITEFDFNVSAQSNGGGLSSLAMSVGVGNGFGLFSTIEVENFAVSIAYSQ